MKSLSQWILASLCASAAALLKEDARMMAYVGNWQTCPSEAQLEQYTHIAIGFAVTYTYAEPKNLCSETCVIEVPLICENQADPSIISDWKSRGIKVLLSFGGAGMGGSWEGDVNDCWKYCFGREDYVIGRLVELVNTMNLDGIDLDYEYFLEDEPERGFTEGAAAINFLETVTVGLRQQMPDKILTHAPMDVDAVAGTAYYEMLGRIAYTMDFIMPQYYNGVTRPNVDGFMNQVQGEMSPLDHYNGLLPLFEYDPTRIVFGFCINDCGGTGSNSDATQASTVITELESQFPCHGGAFFWVNLDDTNGDWSRGVNQALSFNRGCTNIGGVSPTPPPLAVPVSVPVALPAPTSPIGVSPVPVALPIPSSPIGISPVTVPIPIPTPALPSAPIAFPSPLSPIGISPVTVPIPIPTSALPSVPVTSPISSPLSPSLPVGTPTPTFPVINSAPPAVTPATTTLEPTELLTPTASPIGMVSIGNGSVTDPNEPNFYDPNNSLSYAVSSFQASLLLVPTLVTWALLM